MRSKGVSALNYFHAKKVEPSDFKNVGPRLKNKDFKKVIPQLHLADIFLINIKIKSRKFKLIPYFKLERASKCSKCNSDKMDDIQLYSHIYSEKHKSAMQDESAVYYHPALTISDHKDDPNSYQKALDQENEKLCGIPRFIFLMAHTRAKKVMDSIRESGCSFVDSTLEFSGKAIVDSATEKEFETAQKALQTLTKRENKIHIISKKFKNYEKMLEEEIERGNPNKISKITDKRRNKIENLFKKYKSSPKAQLDHSDREEVIVNGKILNFDMLSNRNRKSLKRLHLNNDDLFFISTLIGPIKEKQVSAFVPKHLKDKSKSGQSKNSSNLSRGENLRKKQKNKFEANMHKGNNQPVYNAMENYNSNYYNAQSGAFNFMQPEACNFSQTGERYFQSNSYSSWQNNPGVPYQTNNRNTIGNFNSNNNYVPSTSQQAFHQISHSTYESPNFNAHENYGNQRQNNNVGSGYTLNESSSQQRNVTINRYNSYGGSGRW